MGQVKSDHCSIVLAYHTLQKIVSSYEILPENHNSAANNLMSTTAITVIIYATNGMNRNLQILTVDMNTFVIYVCASNPNATSVNHKATFCTQCGTGHYLSHYFSSSQQK